MMVQERKIRQRTLGPQGWHEQVIGLWNLLKCSLSSQADGCNRLQAATCFGKVWLLECQREAWHSDSVALSSSFLTSGVLALRAECFLAHRWSPNRHSFPFRTLGWVGRQPKSTVVFSLHKDDLCPDGQQHRAPFDVLSMIHTLNHPKTHRK